MKPLLFSFTLAAYALLPMGAVSAVTVPVSQVSTSDTPTITTVKGRVVKVQVPPGFDRVGLDRRAVFRNRPWVPLSTQPSHGGGQELTFRLRTPFPKRLLRVVGHPMEQVPAQFLGGPSNFLADPALAGVDSRAVVSGGISFDGGVTVTNSANLSLSLSQGTTVSSTARDVVESDIWKLQGDRLYVFNSYRGLQSIDVSDATQPALLGTLYLPSAGDQLYLLNDRYAALLVRSSGNFTWNNEAVTTSQGEVQICDVSKGAPVTVATLPVTGRFVESRLVGTALYVATEVPTSNDQYYRTDLRVTGYDLRDPAHPVLRNAVTVPAPSESSYSYIGAVQASDHYFLVAQNIYGANSGSDDYRSRIVLVDISSPNGSVTLRGKVQVEGFVPDKFKMREQDGVVSVISDYFRWSNDGSARHTHLENFSLANPGAPKSIGELDLGLNESVRGTRFDGDRVYVVTFFQIDPLWIVDNSKPAAPKVVGHLQVPGFSTYLEPLGDRLVTVGYVDNRVSVSLFDVADAANPKVLSQLPVTSQWSYSEATWNEKAFAVLPEAGLIMLPVDSSWLVSAGYGGYSTTPVGNIQLVDLSRDSLKLRGRITHHFSPRRSAVHHDTVLALGNASLLSADITNRDQPTILSDLQLAWRADRVWHVGKYLVQLGGSIEGYDQVLSVSPAGNPDQSLSTLTIGGEPVIAADYRDGYVYVVQQASAPRGFVEGGSTTPPVKLGIYNVGSLPVIVKAGETAHADLPRLNSFGAQILWPVPGTLVVAASPGFALYDFGYSTVYFSGPVTDGAMHLFGAASGVSVTQNLTIAQPVSSDLVAAKTDSSLSTSSTMFVNSSIWFYPFYRQPSREHLLAFDVTQPATPALLGLTTIEPKTFSFFSRAFAGDGKVFLTHQHAWSSFYSVIFTATSDTAISSEDPVPDKDSLEALRGRYFLDVVDYSNSATPVMRPPVSAPGMLQGLTHDSQVLYTVGPDYEASGKPKGGFEVLHASAYDGTKLQLAATYPLGSFDAKVLSMGNRLFAFTTKPSPEHDNHLASYTQLVEFGDDAKFTMLGETIFSGYDAQAYDGVLFARQYLLDSYGLTALDFTNPADLRKLGFFPTAWLYPDLNLAIGNRQDGFWFPLGAYGVLHVDLPK